MNLKKSLAVLRILIRGSLGNRTPAERAAFITESGEIITRIQYATFEVLLVSVFLFSIFLTVHYLSIHALAWGHFYQAPAFPGAVYSAICLLAMRMRWVQQRTIIRAQVAIFLPLLTIGLAFNGGIINTGMMWMMSLPFLAQVYGGAWYSVIITAGAILCATALSLMHYFPDWLYPIQYHDETLFQVTVVAFFGVGISGLHVVFQSLKQRRMAMVEHSLFHVRNSQSTVTTVREMAGAVAHQMNTPLSTYYLAIEQVRMQLTPTQAADPEVQTILQRMDSAIERITQVNRSLLVVTSHTEANTPSQMDLRRAMNMAIEAFRNSSRQERPQMNVMDNGVSAKIVAPEGALSQYLWRVFSICEEQLGLGSKNTTANKLNFKLEITEASSSVTLRVAADLVGESFSADLPNSLSLLGAHMIGSSANITSVHQPDSHIEVLLTFQKAGTTAA